MLSRPSCPLAAVASYPDCVGYKQLGRLTVPKPLNGAACPATATLPCHVTGPGNLFLLHRPVLQHRYLFFIFYFFLFVGKGLCFCFPIFFSFLVSCVSYVFLCWDCSNVFTVDHIQISVVVLCLLCWRTAVFGYTARHKNWRRGERLRKGQVSLASIHLKMEIAVLVIGWAGSQVSSGWTSCPGRDAKREV